MSTAVKFVAYPDGPKQFIPELGCEVGTFTQPVEGKFPALKWHVPLKMRGDFKPEDLADYDPQKTYRTDDYGRVLCYAITLAGERCQKRAVNRFPRCDVHGGRVHPLDKVVREDNSGNGESLSRYQAFKKGLITVEDLDDEELACCGFRASNGRIYRPRNVPREVAQAFTKAIYERAQAELRSHVVKAAQVTAEIMMNKTIEPDIRLKAASTLLDRNLGKAPQVVSITNQQPWEEIFEGITSGTREASRARRAITSERILEGEIVSEDVGQRNDTPPNANGDTQFGVPSETDPRGRETTGGNAGYSEQTGNKDPLVAREEPELSIELDSRETETIEIDPEPLSDARRFERNEAILAQTIELKPFQYDLTDRREEIKKATAKRYVSRALGIDITGKDVPLIRVEKSSEAGKLRVRHVNPEDQKIDTKKIQADTQRKRFTLSDFGDAR